jgi:hypothetical protein
MRGWRFTAVVMLIALSSQAEAARLTVTASRTEALYSQTAEPDCSALSKIAGPDLPFYVVRLSVAQPVTDGSVRYRWSEPSPAVGVFAADLDLGPDDETRLIRSFSAELGNACVLTGEALALYDRPTILWIAPTCDVLPKDTTRPYRGDRVRFAVQALSGKRRVGRGSVTVGYGHLASTTMLVADPPFDNFRDGHGKPDGEKIFINPAFGATVDLQSQAQGQTLPTVKQYNFDSGSGGTVVDTPPCQDFPAAGGLAACAVSPLYTSGGKHLASLQADMNDGSALCDKLTVNVRVAPLSVELDVSTSPSTASAFIPGDPTRGSPLLRVRAKNTSPTDIGGILFTGNLLRCETQAKVSGTTLTRDTEIDLQHCSATVSQACTNNSDCEAASCPTCQPKEFCLTSDHCSGSQSLVIGCTSDRDCQAPRCKICEANETCVKVLPASQIFLAPGDSVDLIETNVSLINVLTTPAKVRETWTVHSFNAGDASDGLRYRIQPRPDVKPPTP